MYAAVGARRVPCVPASILCNNHAAAFISKKVELTRIYGCEEPGGRVCRTRARHQLQGCHNRPIALVQRAKSAKIALSTSRGAFYKSCGPGPRFARSGP